jgi:parallel beta-helix repeat protein
MMKSFFAAVFVCSALTLGHGGTIPVAPTGTCAGDLSAIQNAVNSAQPRDVVQLAPGAYDFSCLTSDNSPGVFVGNPDITIQGAAGQSVITGPGFASQAFSIAFFVGADGVTFDGVFLQSFFAAIQSSGPPQSANNLAVTNSIFQNNVQAIQVAADNTSPRIVGNSFSLPTPSVSDIFSPFGQSTAVIIGRHCGNLLFAKNTITGPGVAAHFQTIDQLIADPRSTGIGLRTIGFFQADFSGDIAELGRVSDNTFTGLDLAMQASSNIGIVARNTVTGNAVGIVVSNDFDDGVHRVTQNLVTDNVSTGNQVGIWMASATDNTITLNDLQHNSLAGLLFLANPGGALSTGNFFHQNKGSIVGAAGNSSF